MVKNTLEIKEKSVKKSNDNWLNRPSVKKRNDDHPWRNEDKYFFYSPETLAKKGAHEIPR